MDDEQIIALYFARDERAVEQTELKYDRAMKTLAMRILSDIEDSRECVNDTYLKVWNTIPPTKPIHLSAYLHKIVRHLSIDRLRSRQSDKRKGNEYTASIEELSECLGGAQTPQQVLELELLTQCIEAYLKKLSKQQRQMFLCRYFFLDPIKKIAEYFAISEAKTKSTLYRIRCGLKQHLHQEGFTI